MKRCPIRKVSNKRSTQFQNPIWNCRGADRKQITWVRKPRPRTDVVGDCIICTSHSLDRNGYPEIMRNGKRTKLPRLVMFRRHGPQSPDIQARHTCDTPACINPDHIVPGTMADNVRDSVSRGRNHMGSRTSKLTETDVVEIRRLLYIGEKRRTIAPKFGVCRGTITCISIGKTWRHVP
jgi:hypothetical protein